MCLGFFLGLAAASGIITMATPDCSGAGTCFDWYPYAAAGAILVGGFLLGAVFVATVGSMTTFMIGGSAIALIVALVNGLWLRLPGFVLIGFASWVVGHGQAARYGCPDPFN